MDRGRLGEESDVRVVRGCENGVSNVRASRSYDGGCADVLLAEVVGRVVTLPLHPDLPVPTLTVMLRIRCECHCALGREGIRTSSTRAPRVHSVCGIRVVRTSGGGLVRNRLVRDGTGRFEVALLPHTMVVGRDEKRAGLRREKSDQTALLRTIAAVISCSD